MDEKFLNKVICGNSYEVLKELPDNSVDSIVTDPPYGIKLMNKKWDYEIPTVELWKEAIRVLKEGGYILVACGTRTQHRMAVNIEDAGFDIKNIITWHYGQGFPKSYTDLKPATEFWTLAKKPFNGSVAENISKWGVGELNIDGCRIKTDDNLNGGAYSGGERSEGDWKENSGFKNNADITYNQPLGRFPANVVFSHHPDCVCIGIKNIKGTSTGNGDALKGEESNGSIPPIRRGEFTDRTNEDGTETIEEWECVYGCPIKELDSQSGILTSGAMKKAYIYTNNGFSMGKPTGSTKQIHESNEGYASRFFYCAKASKRERNLGLCDINTHPTVKPVRLCQWLVRLITPEKGIVLDMFTGSGTTLVASKLEGFNFIGIEMEEKSCITAIERVEHWELYKEDAEIQHRIKEEISPNQLDLFAD